MSVAIPLSRNTPYFHESFAMLFSKDKTSTEKLPIEVSTGPDIETGTTIPIGADAALTFLQSQAGESFGLENINEKKLVRKIDRCIVPLMWGCYFLQYLDKTLINYANVMGLQADTNTSASQFSQLALVFYVSYLFCEPIHAYLMQRYPTAKYLGAMVVCWGKTSTTVSKIKPQY